MSPMGLCQKRFNLCCSRFILHEQKQSTGIENVCPQNLSFSPSARCSSNQLSSKFEPLRQPRTRAMYSSVTGCRTMRPKESSRNLTFVPARIPCFLRSSAGTTSWPLDVNVALKSLMPYMLSQSKTSWCYDLPSVATDEACTLLSKFP